MQKNVCLHCDIKQIAKLLLETQSANCLLDYTSGCSNFQVFRVSRREDYLIKSNSLNYTNSTFPGVFDT